MSDCPTPDSNGARSGTAGPTNKPVGAVAWLSLPMPVTGMGHLVRGLEMVYGKGLRVVAHDDGFWVVTR